MKSERNVAPFFFTAALFYLLLAAALGVLMIAGVLAGSVIKGAHAHIALLGWASLTIMGAMYQIVPTVIGRKLYSKSLAQKQFWLTNAGILGIAAGFAKGSFETVAAFGAVAFASFCLFAFIAYKTMSGAKLELTLRFFACSIFYLLCAAALGAIISSGIMPRTSDTVIAHAALGFGWISATIMGAMYQMFPMLSMREIHSRRIGTATFWLVNPSVVGFSAGTLLGVKLLSQVSVAAFVLGCYLFAYVLFMTLLKKVKIPQQKLNLSIKYFVVALVYFIAAVSAGAYSLKSYQVEVVHMAALGFITITIIGAMYHLMPMLIWIDKYAGKMGLGKVPTTKELFSERLEVMIFYAFNIGIIGLLAAFLAHVKTLQLLFGSVVIAALASFSYAMISIELARPQDVGKEVNYGET